MFKEFKEFAFKGDVVNLAIGVVIGAAFSAIIKSFVDNLINPLIGLVGGGKAALDALVIHVTPTVSITYGAFLSAVLNFVIVAFSLFLVVKSVNRFRKQEEEADDRECPRCLTLIPKAATRCSACTSELTAE
ncbi:MAG: large conductance mechanosensitive channel protein MscL [Coriobacteriia bacterium]|nr:large conductance mechanosensitive channel protein MscL [Coriobacteriia bacterium]